MEDIGTWLLLLHWMLGAVLFLAWLALGQLFKPLRRALTKPLGFQIFHVIWWIGLGLGAIGTIILFSLLSIKFILVIILTFILFYGPTEPHIVRDQINQRI